MPKVVLSRALQEREEKRRMLLGVLAKYRQIGGFVSWAEAAERCGIRPSTMYRRIKTPEDFTITELRQVASGMKIPAAEILPCIC